jgi:hypothetical protein
MAEDHEIRGADQWKVRLAECREAVAQLEWLVGRWRGYGEYQGSGRESIVETKYFFDRSFIESRERIYTPDGKLEHEDLTIYAAARGRGPGEVCAHLYITGGLIIRYKVEVFGESLLADPEDFGSRLAIQRLGDSLRMRVYSQDDQKTWIEDVTLDYEPYG